MKALSKPHLFGNFTSIRNFFIHNLGRKILHWLERAIASSSLVENTPFLSTDCFTWTKELENNWQVIKQELDVILKATDKLPSFHEISQDQYNLSKDNQWKTYFLYGYGIKMSENCKYCPETTRLIEGVPGMKTAFFSILLPGKHIPEHRGPYKGVLRYHLALKVPQDRENCRIRVDDEFSCWSEGKGILFDDSYPHEVWNSTDEVRVVLFMDIVRPCKFPISLLNQLLIYCIRWSPFIQDARKNQNQWNKRLQEIFGN